VKELVRTGELSAGQARTLLGAQTPQEISRLAAAAAAGGLTVRQLEERIKATRPDRGKARNRSRPSPGPAPSGLSKYEDELRQLYGTKVSISEAAGRGEIRLTYYSSEDGARIIHQLLTGESEARAPILAAPAEAAESA